MTLPWEGNRPKTKVADEIILSLMDSIYKVNKDVEFSLRVFGHQSTVAENDCHDTKNEVPFKKDNRLQMEYRLDDIKPLGVTSIAYALMQAAEYDLVDVTRNAYSIILITDGGESCGGDICAVMQKLAQSKVFFRPYIVNLESSPLVRASYACMGDYLEVTKKSELPTAVSRIVQAFRPVITVNEREYTKVKEIAAQAPTVMNVTIPVVKLTDTVKTKVIEPTPPPPPPPPPAPKKPEPININALPHAGARALRIFGEAPATAKVRAVSPYKAVINEETPPPPPPAPEPRPVFNVDKAMAASIRPLATSKPVATAVRTIGVQPYKPLIVDEPVEKPAPVAIDRLKFASASRLAISNVRTDKAVVRTVAPYQPLIVEELPTLPPPVTIAKLRPTPPKRVMTFILLENGSVIQYRNKLPGLPPFKYDVPPPPPPAPVAKTAPVKPTVPPVKDDKAAEYTMEKEDAEETTVEVYFTNGHGKFFPNTPQVLLLEPKTDKMIKRFYRTVDADGNPDPRTDITPGTYKMAFSESRGMVVNNVVIEPKKKNKIIVTVKRASLSFEYAGSLTRPVKEFEATVIERNRVEGGAVVRQKCTERLEFEPGNYHVEINTFPMDRRNIDLDFDERVITIPQPGFAKFTGEADMVSVTLYQRLGEKFLSFSTIRLADPVAQHLQIQPGEYQAHYHKGPGSGPGNQKVVNFFIRPTETTEVILK